jgi:manganese transport protein
MQKREIELPSALPEAVATEKAMNKKFANILLWLVISAAFIGPGTVITASMAGNMHQFQLLWALLFSTLTCILLQEAAARISIVSGKDIGEAVLNRFSGKKGRNIARLLVFSVILGCAAYEAGNIVGAVSGLALVTSIDPKRLTLVITLSAGLLLASNNIKLITSFLGILVAIMGLGFIVMALKVTTPSMKLIEGAFTPTFPSNSSLLIIALIGTTIVPYNLFLGSGIAKGKKLKSMRIGVSIAILIGGLISVAILLVGTSISGAFSIEALAQQMETAFGKSGPYLFAIGLFAAGFTSAVTAPLAAAMAFQSIYKKQEQRKNYFLITGLVLLTGFIFGMLQVKPTVIIVAAQALNGLILPLMGIVIWLIINNSHMMKNHRNEMGLNLLFLLVVWVTVLLGLKNILAVYQQLFHSVSSNSQEIIFGISIILMLPITWLIKRERSIE